MNLMIAMKHTVSVAAFGAAAAALFGSTASISACGESGTCARLRDDTFAARETWRECNPLLGPNACVKVFGNPQDCTGVLNCNLAVAPAFVVIAEKTVTTIGRDSLGCYQCAQPNCDDGMYPYCNPASRFCELVTEIPFDAGVYVGSGTVPRDSGAPVVDSGTPPPPAPDAATEAGP